MRFFVWMSRYFAVMYAVAALPALLAQTPGTEGFSMSATYTVGSQPNSIGAADFDGDGRIDLAVATFNHVSILLNQGEGLFTQPVSYTVGNLTSSLVIADFNLDGHPDIAVTNRGQTDISVLAGNGDGTFAPAVSHPAGGQPVSAVAGDYNEDGRPDLAVLSVDGRANIFVLVGGDDNTFSPAPAQHMYYADALATGDFDRDGHLDLAVVNSLDGMLQVFRGNGDGTFVRGASVWSIYRYAHDIIPADFDGDGSLDLAVACDAAINILRGAGDGTFALPMVLPSAAGPWHLAPADFDGDGGPDLAVANYSSRNVSIILHPMDGATRSEQNYAAGQSLLAIAAADFNADGRTDFAVTSGLSASVNVFVAVPSTGPVTIMNLTPVQTYFRVSTAVTGRFGAAAGVPPYTYSVAAGALPPGVTLDPGTGVITGACSITGVYPFTIRVTDASGGTDEVAVSYHIVAPAPVIQAGTGQLSATAGTWFEYQIQVTGGELPFLFAAGSGAWPQGVSLNASTGLISGTPAAAGSYSFSVAVADAVFRETGDVSFGSFVLTVSAPLKIQTTALAPAVVNANYSQELIAAGGAPPYSWSIAGSLPPGLFLTEAGVIEGAASATGTFSFKISVRDSAGDKVTVTYELVVGAAGGPVIWAGGVVNGASFLPGISSGAWASIFGHNLATIPAPGRTWQDSDFAGEQLPLSLEGVSVTIDGKPAAVCYVGPDQINVQVPDGIEPATVQVVVRNALGTAAATAVVQPSAPAFFIYDAADWRYIAAQHGAYSVVGPPGLFPGVESTPARPGEEIILYGTGFGPTNPPTPAGFLVSGPAPLADSSTLVVTVGGQRATVTFAGITMAGVWQINIRIPAALADGDAQIVAEIGGVRTQENAWIAVKAQTAQ